MKLGRVVFTAYVGLFFAGLYVPIALLIGLGFNSGSRVYVWEGFTFENYGVVLRIPSYTSAFSSSILIALGTTGFSVILGTLAGLSAARRTSGRFELLWSALVLLPLIVPEIVESLSIFLFYRVLHIPLGTGATIIGHTVFSVSFVALIVRARMADFGKAYEEASMVLGAGRMYTFANVLLPMAAPAVIAGGFLAFAASFDDVIKSAFTTTPASRTLPIVIFAEASRGGISTSLAALSALMVAISISSALARVLVERRLSRR